MRAVIIEGGKVVNATALPTDAAIAADGKSASWPDAESEGGTHVWAAPDGATLYASDAADIGWSVSKDGVPVAPTPAAVVVPVPPSVSSAQAKIQCLRSPAVAGGKTLLDDIMTAVQAKGGEAAIWFSDARTWERANPYVAQLSSGLKLTSDQVDQLFIKAAQISA